MGGRGVCSKRLEASPLLRINSDTSNPQNKSKTKYNILYRLKLRVFNNNYYTYRYLRSILNRFVFKVFSIFYVFQSSCIFNFYFLCIFNSFFDEMI